MLSEAQQVALTGRFQRRVATLSTNTARHSVEAWDGLGSWNRADIARFGARTERVFTAATSAASELSAGYYATLADTGVTIPSSRIVADLEAPFTAYWHELRTRPWVDALAFGRTRAESIATDLVVGVTRDVAGQVAGESIVGWRRVLTGASCSWCATIATQRYHSVESATFGHDNCDCIVIPIWGDVDPGQVINARHIASAAPAA